MPSKITLKICIFFGFFSSVVQAATYHGVSRINGETTIVNVPNTFQRATTHPSLFHFPPASSPNFGFRTAHLRNSFYPEKWFSNNTSHYAPSTRHHAGSRQGGLSITPLAQPRLEVIYTDQTPYVSQPVVVTVRLIGDTNLATLTVDIPNQSGLRIEKLAGPTARVVTLAGQRKILTEYQYLYTPLRSGLLPLPTIATTGSYTSFPYSNGSRSGYPWPTPGLTQFSLQQSNHQTWQVQPAVVQEGSWRPLQDLRLYAYLTPNYIAKLAAGNPIQYTIRLSAEGTTGDLLPNMARQLEAQDFKWYLEEVRTSGGLNQVGELRAERLETYTLIPQRNGNLHIPSLHVSWWNLAKQRSEIAILPARSLTAAMVEETVVQNKPAAILSPFGMPDYLSIIRTIVLLIVGWWIFFGSRKFPTRIPFRSLRPTKVSRWRISLPAGAWRAVWVTWSRKRCASAVPGPVKAWHCIRCVQLEHKPASVSRLLQIYAHKQLGLPRQSSLQGIAQGLLAAHPSLDTVSVQALFEELDRAVYGGGHLDFPSWKRRFRKILKPLFCSWRSNGRTVVEALPALNPIHSRS